MSDILKILFTDNPALESKIYQFFSENPDYQNAEQQYTQITKLVEEKLGCELYCQFEECLNGYTGRQAYAYYLFGLGLRQEILDSMRDVL